MVSLRTGGNFDCAEVRSIIAGQDAAYGDAATASDSEGLELYMDWRTRTAAMRDRWLGAAMLIEVFRLSSSRGGCIDGACTGSLPSDEALPSASSSDGVR